MKKEETRQLNRRRDASFVSVASTIHRVVARLNGITRIGVVYLLFIFYFIFFREFF